jgi:HEAT repeat protein
MRLIAILLTVLCGSAIAVAQPKQAPPTGIPRVRKLDLGPEIAALGGPDLDAAVKAAETLGSSTQPEAHDALLDALALGLPGRVAMPAMTALALHPAPADVVALKRYAGHHNPNVRATAITALAAYPDPVAKATIVAALHDPTGLVRSAGAGAASKGRVRDAVDSLLKLLAKGEESSARSLAALADPDLARKIADHYGKVPEVSLALALGLILRRTDFGPDPARVEVVRAIAKIQDPTAVKELQDYVAATPKNPPRPSLQEAKLVIDARGGK